MKKNKIKTIASLIIIFLTFLSGVIVYPKIPEMAATHWGISGEANGFSSRNFAVFFVPVLSLGLFLLFRFLPKVDPYRKNFSQFKEYYDNFVLLVLSFMFYLHLLTLLWNGYDLKFNMTQAITPAFAALFYYAGILTANAKRNWFVGIRTPWTLSNEVVWQKTHKIGSTLFKITAVISFVGILIPQYAVFFILIPIILLSAFIYLYSYLEYRKEMEKSQN